MGAGVELAFSETLRRLGDSGHCLKNGIINRGKGELFWEAPNSNYPNSDFPLIEMSAMPKSEMGMKGNRGGCQRASPASPFTDGKERALFAQQVLTDLGSHCSPEAVAAFPTLTHREQRGKGSPRSCPLRTACAVVCAHCGIYLVESQCKEQRARMKKANIPSRK